MSTLKTTFTATGVSTSPVSSINSVALSMTKDLTVNDPEEVGAFNLANDAKFDVLPFADNASGTFVYVENANTSGTSPLKVRVNLGVNDPTTGNVTAVTTDIVIAKLLPGEWLWIPMAHAADVAVAAALAAATSGAQVNRGLSVVNDGTGGTIEVKYATFSR
tara:strand:+ start:555 stop:1040 length:486 start_codon:yes stop_codon:yes gene_type:complete